ncbi:MAG: Hint domain-containing protein [Silicimonas sp.]|nr:Hint domain-containing protein [Silicimonas sp.]
MARISPCFTPGTLIATDRGQRPVETLRRGDRLVTRDNGLKRITWTGGRSFSYGDLQDCEPLRPVLVRAHALGENRPRRDTIVSPEHRFLIRPHEVAGAEPEVLVAAKHLVDGKGVRWADMLGVSYLHLLMNAHEVILANGAWTESFHPDDKMMRDLAPDQRQEILLLFPEVATMGAARRFPAARPIGKSRFDS